MPTKILVAAISACVGVCLIGLPSSAQAQSTGPDPFGWMYCGSVVTHLADGKPHEQGLNSPNGTEVCHGTSGDFGSCTRLQGDSSATVFCYDANAGRIWKPPLEKCRAILDCDTGNGTTNGSCGGVDQEVFAGHDSSGRAFIRCQPAGGNPLYSPAVEVKCN